MNKRITLGSLFDGIDIRTDGLKTSVSMRCHRNRSISLSKSEGLGQK